MKKISINLRDKDNWHIEECLGRLIPNLKTCGFTTGGSHCTINLVPKSAWFFCENMQDENVGFVFDIFPCYDCPYKESQIIYDIDIDLSQRSLKYFGDYSGSNFSNAEVEFFTPLPTGSLNCQIVAKLQEKKVFLGVYCKKLHILHATDWTHDRENIETAKEVLQALNELVNFQEVVQRIDKETGEQKQEPEQEKEKEIRNYKVKLGCDPEFEQLSNWNRYSVIETNISTYSCESGEIGVDGAGYQVEFRPNPAYTPEELVDNIKNLFENISVPLSVKGDIYPLGGHIHLGLPREFIGNSLVRDFILEVLDDFIGAPLINLSGRARGSYKRLSSYREQPHGLEYRPLPSAYLFNPKFTRITFKITKNVVESLLNQQELEYNETPTREDYMRIANLTEEEYESFCKFIENYRNYDGTQINKNWVPSEKIPFVIRFRDEWDEKNKKIFKALLSQYEGELKNIGIYEIVLYGLRRDRGDYVVAGFEVEGYQTISHPGSKFEGWFGIPARLRKGDEVEVEIERVVNGILNQIGVKTEIAYEKVKI